MFFIRGARQLVTLRGAPPRRGTALSDLSIITDGALLIEGETIREVGTTRRIENLAATRQADVIDATGKVVLPGFVDSHTQPLSTEAPLAEFEAWIDGVLEDEQRPPELESTWYAPRRRHRSPKVMRQIVRRWAEWFAAHGTTAFEARSVSGLELAAQLKVLRILGQLDREPLDVVVGAQAAPDLASDSPRGLDRDVDRVTQELLPIIGRRRLASFCSVECGEHAFDRGRSARILGLARQLGLGIRVCANRSGAGGGARLAVKLNATSAEHLLWVNDAEIDALADSSTIATLLPAVEHHWGEARYAPARQFVDRGAAIALATGFSPGSTPTLSMPMVLSLACRYMKLRPAEAIAAATINGAACLRRADRIGSLEPGKQADLAIYDAADYREIPYYFGINLCIMTIKRGKIIYPAGAAAPASALHRRSDHPEGGLTDSATRTEPSRRAGRVGRTPWHGVSE